jgi:transcriptional regulator with PAS, ATPase and Fis domain
MVGKIEAANGGTLFLDEIGEMPLDLQPYFLRVLEGGEVHLGYNSPRKVQLRLVAASNRDLSTEVAAGRFRRDLFYRISATSVQIPSLRERKEDIPALVESFSRDVAQRHAMSSKRFDPDVLKALERPTGPATSGVPATRWSLALLAQGDVVGLADLPACRGRIAERAGWTGPEGGLEGVERDAISNAIRKHGGNLTRAANELRISKSTLYLKMKKYALEPVLNEVRFAKP